MNAQDLRELPEGSVVQTPISSSVASEGYPEYFIRGGQLCGKDFISATNRFVADAEFLASRTETKVVFTAS